LTQEVLINITKERLSNENEPGEVVPASVIDQNVLGGVVVALAHFGEDSIIHVGLQNFLEEIIHDVTLIVFIANSSYSCCRGRIISTGNFFSFSIKVSQDCGNICIDGLFRLIDRSLCIWHLVSLIFGNI